MTPITPEGLIALGFTRSEYKHRYSPEHGFWFECKEPEQGSHEIRQLEVCRGNGMEDCYWNAEYVTVVGTQGHVNHATLRHGLLHIEEIQTILNFLHVRAA